MSLEVVELSPENDVELTAFLDAVAQRSPSVLAYHYPFYRDMLTKLGVGRPVCLGLRQSGQLRGYLPAFVKESESGCVLSSLPFFGPNAGVLCHHEDRSIAHQWLLHDFLRRAEEMGALSCSIYTPFSFREFALYDTHFAPHQVVEKFTQYLDLEAMEWPKDIERKLRRAERASVSVSSEVTDERLSAFYEIYRRNCADYGIPLKPWECIQSLAGDAARGKYTHFYFAYIDGNLVAGLLVLFSPLTASYYIPCSVAEFRTHQPGTLLAERAMSDARSLGLKYWNWESSPGRDSGVYTFKKRWGSLEDGYRVYVKTFQSEEKIRQVGRDRIAKEFPYYFVWPFDRL
jgi:hypothetical protein